MAYVRNETKWGKEKETLLGSFSVEMPHLSEILWVKSAAPTAERLQTSIWA